MIETKRLRIIPLDSEQFALLLNGVHFMEDALRLTPSNETLDPHTRQAMTGHITVVPVGSIYPVTDFDAAFRIGEAFETGRADGFVF